MRYEIVPCKLSHLRVLAATMRAEDRAELESIGVIARHGLYELWRQSEAPMTALIDGEVAAAWGDTAGTLETEGRLWLFTAPIIERMPLAFFRETRRVIGTLLECRTSLKSRIIGPYDKAMRFFAMLGFEIGEPEILNGVEHRIIRIRRHGP